MFILSNIKAKTPEQVFQPHKRKYLKFQFGPAIKKHPFPSRLSNFHQIQWDAPMIFPEDHYNHPITFQIYQRHSFGYDEKELDATLSGKLIIQKDMETFSTDIISVSTNQSIGFLSGRIKHKGQTVEQVIEKKIAKVQRLQIKSIVGNNFKYEAHIPLAVNKKIFFKIKVGKQELKTASVKSYCGDLVFAEPLAADKLDLQTKGVVSIWQVKGDAEIKLGTGTIELIGVKPAKKVTLFDFSQELLGQAYIDSLQQDKEQLKGKSHSLPSYLRKMSPLKIMQKTSASMLTASSFKKVSIVNPNQSIIFTTEQRFKPNPETTSKSRSFRQSKMPFSQMRVNRIFNKAAQLPVISQDETPGVGNYVLPSIWDRY